MKSKWIKKDDRVLVISGNDRGKVGIVVAKKDERVLVQGVNVRKRHMKSRDQKRRSEIVNIERPIHISNVALCLADGRKIKVKPRLGEDGGKELVYFDKDKEISYRKFRKPSGKS